MLLCHFVTKSEQCILRKGEQLYLC
uniref:Uncharacterized protein n=1 Tax=Anguilla anguilla TaxID=7936 RepID=A0A0E9UUZ9_ANGAN